MHNRKVAVLIFCWLIVLALPAAGAGDNFSKKEQLARRIDSILAEAHADGCNWAIEVVSLGSGEPLYKRNAELLMIPASNMKLFTTAAALYYLGPDFTVKTSFYFKGKLKRDGVLDGDVIIYGRGDPNISGRFTGEPTAIFQAVIESLKTLGLREVHGDIVGDDSYFDSQYYGPWPRDESHKWYAARVSALSFNDNCVDIYVRPGPSVGSRPEVIQSPRTSYVRVINKASTTNQKGNAVWISPSGSTSSILVGGKIWSKKEEKELWFPVDLPALYAATVFEETLQANGISVSGRARGLGTNHKSAVPQGADPVVEYESLPLSEIIKVVNKRSQNLHAELLLKQIGLRAGAGPTFDGGSKAVHDFVCWTGIPQESVIVYDGSGLSRLNRASAHSLVELLKFMHERGCRDPFRDSLAVVGVDESLQEMAKTVPSEKVAGKTGSLKGVLAFSGYAEGESQRLAFSIIANGFEKEPSRIRQVRDRIVRELARY